MRFFKPASAACMCVGLTIALALLGTGIGMSFYVANLFSGRARRAVGGVTTSAAEWMAEANFTLSGITQDVTIPSQPMQIEIDASHLVNPILDTLAELPDYLGVTVPDVNKTLFTTINTNEVVLPVTIEGISISLAALIGEQLMQDIIDVLDRAPELTESISYYFLLAVGIIATLIITNALLDKVLYGGMGLWLQGGVNAAAKERRQAAP